MRISFDEFKRRCAEDMAEAKAKAEAERKRMEEWAEERNKANAKPPDLEQYSKDEMKNFEKRHGVTDPLHAAHNVVKAATLEANEGVHPDVSTVDKIIDRNTLSTENNNTAQNDDSKPRPNSPRPT